jgi:outer membrane biosynthesis protein TonB|tara:strand:+ start:819 stop:1187 length:369 start_codon:yes stop_codon:yes gene_type:complete
MPTAKKPAAKKAAPKKKAPAKKAAPKKAAPKKAAPKKVVAAKVEPQPAPPEKRFEPVSVYLLTNGGENIVTFSDKEKFDAAMSIIKLAPAEIGGSRSITTYIIEHDGGSLGFQLIQKYEIKA